jgi:hypothetical protein
MLPWRLILNDWGSSAGREQTLQREETRRIEEPAIEAQ